MKYSCVPCETFAFFAVKFYRKVRKENAKDTKSPPSGDLGGL